MFKLNPVLLSLIATQGLIFPVLPAAAVVLRPFTPEVNDNKYGAHCLCNGSTQTLSGLPRFTVGESGTRPVTLGELQTVGRIVDDDVIGKPRIQLGAQNYNIGVPDYETDSYTIYQVYNSAEIVDIPVIGSETAVPDYYDVNDKQYINTRVASVSNGTMNIDIGQYGAAADSATNSWSMAAKQSQLFAATRKGQINWNANNRITFTAATPPYGGDRLAFDAGGIVDYAGLFDIPTLDGGSTSYYVSNLTQLRQYNDWLIDLITSGIISPERYNAEFNKAFTLREGRVVYRMSTNNIDDEVAAALGDQVVLSAEGRNARVSINRGKTLEVKNSASEVMRASHGAKAVINGTLSTSNAFSSEAGALALTYGARGINNGVINSGFFTNADGTGVSADSLGYAGTAVRAIYNSHFRNNGVLNIHIGAAPWGTRGLFLGDSSAVNHGNINLGITNVANGSSASAVSFSGEGRFVNAADGTLYIGRAPQNARGDSSEDVAVSLDGGVSAISGLLDSSAINEGHIVIGSKVENAVGMRVEAGPNATSLNHGVIDVNGQAQPLPRENIAMLAIDSGSGGKVGNTGTINLNGYNSTGLKVIASQGNSAHAFSSGAINVPGDGDRFGSGNNTAVWVTGEPGGSASADLSGPIRLSGRMGIGIRAEGNATVNVSAAAIPVSTGSDSSLDSHQISFYTKGPNARINLPANGSYATSVYNGTIFRVEAGADFAGDGLTLSTNSPFASGVNGSGAGTDVRSGNVTLNIADFANGLEISDGAHATIERAAQIHLNGQYASVAIADGNTFTLQGAVINPLTQFNADTLLTNYADIHGSAREQVPFTVRNHAQMYNYGDITLEGAGVTAITAQYGARLVNRGDITILHSGRGLFADGNPERSDGVTLTEIDNTGTLNVHNDAAATGSSVGITAYHQLGRAVQNGTINLYGERAIGGSAFAGGRLTLGADSRVNFYDARQVGYRAVDPGTRLIVNGSDIDVSGEEALLYEIRNGAWLYHQGFGNVTLSGTNAGGVLVSGSDALVSSTDRYLVTGSGATALRASDRAQGIISNSIVLNGSNTTGAVASGDETEVYAASTITGSGSGATALEVSGGARLFNQDQGVVDLSGANSTGARVHDGGNFINRGRIHLASGIGVDVSSGYGQYVPVDSELRVDDGIAALRTGSGGDMMIYGDGQGASTLAAHGSADGLLLDSGAQRFEANDIVIGAYGSGSALNNRAGISDIYLHNVRLEANGGTGIRSATSFDPGGSAQISVRSGGTGYRFENTDGSTSSSDLVIGPDYRIDVYGTGTGVRANTSGRVIAQGAITLHDTNGGSAIVTRTASEVINQGIISSESRVSPLIDLRGGETLFINQGTINAPYADQTVVAGGATDDVIALLEGQVVGEVNTGNGRDTLQVSGGTLDGSLTMGNGAGNQAMVQNISLANTRHITSNGGAGSTLTLSEIDARGGSFSHDDLSQGTNLGAGWSTLNFNNARWTLTDNLRLAHSTINIDAGSTLFAGNNVQPLLQGGTNDSLVVNNAGNLDLTNGGNTAANTLTINGDLASAGGRLTLNSAATQSDRLLVNGNVSGTTLIEDTLRGAPLMDVNRDGVIAANEGVSLAQVSGSGSAGSVVLRNGYVASGPWQYSLYSFAPGSSDASQRAVSGSGSNFRDYRLANTFVCEDGALCQPQTGSTSRAVRPAVTPQVPAWISAPVGLAYYSLAVTDDLHKRLGELRQQQGVDESPAGEMFIRYIGSNLTYQSQRQLADYGYDFDLDYSAVQLGGNLIQADGVTDSLRGGIAYTRGNTRIRPHAADGYSTTSFDSDTVSLYGTWLRESGMYVDGSLSWGWYRGETDIARQKEVASPKGNGWTASIESGYPFTFANGVRLEPQAQLTWLQVKMDSFTDRDRTRVSFNDYDQTVARLGARVDRTWQDSSQNQYTPWLRANYSQGWGGTAKVRVGDSESDNSQAFESGKFGKMWDVGLGGTVTLKRDVALYAEADYRKEIDGNGAKGWRYNAGVRWSF